MSSPAPRPTSAVDCFKSRCAMGVLGLASSEGTLYCDLQNERTRFEAFGGWSVMRYDLGVAVSQYVMSNPPEPKLHEEPAQVFLPPEDAVYGGEETVDGKSCQKWSFPQRSKTMLTEVELWVTVDADSVATPVLYHMKTPTQTIEMKFLEVEPMETLDDALFDVEQFIPADEPATVSVRGVVTNQDGERVRGVTVAASYPKQGPGNMPEWTTRTGAQTDEQGEYELLLVPEKAWSLTVQLAPTYAPRMLEITPPADGIVPGGEADVALEPAPNMEEIMAAQAKMQAAMAEAATARAEAAAVAKAAAAKAAEDDRKAAEADAAETAEFERAKKDAQEQERREDERRREEEARGKRELEEQERQQAQHHESTSGYDNVDTDKKQKNSKKSGGCPCIVA